MNTTGFLEKINEARLDDALAERYLNYALSTIMSRSLPDVRDGLKPVHRRLLFAMRLLKLDPEAGFKKCARVVGDVMGKFHPHGDQAIYDAMVRLAQEFAVRYPLVEGQGNFGNIDGDNAAAMRYTEARLTKIAKFLLEGIDHDTVDFRQTYDGEEKEPIVLPAAFPNLLANGSTGIAVGMATNIPPHNTVELCNALLHLIKTAKYKTNGITNCRVTFEKLCSLVPGPDFPTGGVLAESKENIIESYRTGRGSFRVRAKWEVEKLVHGQYQIIVIEIPYQVQKAKLIEKIADLIVNKKIPTLEDIRDESDESVRIVIVPKNRATDPSILMEQLFRDSEMEIRFNLNLNVLNLNNIPTVMNLRQVLTAFLEHRQTILLRQTKFRLKAINQRLDVLAGFLIAYINLDKIIQIIRNNDEPKRIIIKKLSLNENQADAILNMRLRQLRKLEEIQIRNEDKSLKSERRELKLLIEDEEKGWRTIYLQIKKISGFFSSEPDIGNRRTLIGSPPKALVIPLEAMIEKEPVTVIYSKKGWIRIAKGHLQDLTSVKFKEGDGLNSFLHAETTDKLLIFATNGRFYTIGVDKLPSARGHGEPIRLMFDIKNEDEVISIITQNSCEKLLLASNSGRGFIVSERNVIAQTRNGKLVLNLGQDEKAAALSRIPPGASHIAVIGTNKKLLIFALDELPVMSRGRGVILQRYKNGGLSDLQAFVWENGVSWMTASGKRSELNLENWVGKRAGAGLIKPKGFPANNRFS
ncbi:MAG: DNA topoisomerase 4 subunit A [Alphaproteobacteria bacterium MarineAlpha3_Bin5]|nr:DNA topoisomerase IV subunit A [Magnetovibrio sp.]PPR79025.1 MAG: DNA topoisomerase 4 subunit A [Alphaproteobacteria bacterium MarineAlpha3_Bin5]